MKPGDTVFVPGGTNVQRANASMAGERYGVRFRCRSCVEGGVRGLRIFCEERDEAHRETYRIERFTKV